ncbi:MAG: MOSC domain-containing protein, partial [Pseudomonadota bacterium]
GMLGDRNYSLIDQTNNKIASAKYPKKWAKILELSAEFLEQPSLEGKLPPVRITSSDGLDILSTDQNVDTFISEFVGRPVKLTTARPVKMSLERLDPLEDEETILDIGDIMSKTKFSDYADVHLLTTASLQALSEISPDQNFDVKRFRPNLVIKTESGLDGFVENDWIGKTIVIGESVRLNITDPTPRCAIPTLGNGELPDDPKVLKTIVEHNMREVPYLENKALPCIGNYAFLVQDGMISINDPVWIE